MFQSSLSVQDERTRPLTKAERRAWQQSITNAGSRILVRYEGTVAFLEQLLEKPDVYVVCRDEVPFAAFADRWEADACSGVVHLVPMRRPQLA